MNNHYLEKELLEESLPAGFQEELLRQTVRTAMRKHRVRQSAIGLVTLALLGTLAINFLRPVRNIEFVKATTPVVTPATQPPRSFNLIATAPLESIISTGSLPPVARLINTRNSFVLVETTPAFLNGLVQISEEELFRLLEGKAVAVVKRTDAPAEVIFLDEQPSNHPGLQ